MFIAITTLSNFTVPIRLKDISILNIFKVNNIFTYPL